MIKVENVSWGVPGKVIVSDVTASFSPGTVSAIVGPNGSGKTSLLHLMAGIRRPNSGRVLLDGLPIDSLTLKQRARKIALVEQHPNTDLDLSAQQVVALGRIPHIGSWPGAKDPDPQAISQAMEIAEVTHLAQQRWGTLSGGERQRIHLARALAQRPQVLLLDEPTNHLDLSHQLSFLEIICQLNICTIAVLHDLDLAAAFCEHLLVMNQGFAYAVGSTSTTLTRELIYKVFKVNAEVDQTDRLRVSWSRQ